MVKLTHCKSSFSGPNPWETAKDKKEKELSASRKRNLAASNDSARSHFARIAHEGGKISSNKTEALYKFLKRKVDKGLELSEQEKKTLAGVGGVASTENNLLSANDDAKILSSVKAKALVEERDRQKMENRESTGGGSNKDCRLFEENAWGKEGKQSGKRKGIVSLKTIKSSKKSQPGKKKLLIGSLSAKRGFGGGGGLTVVRNQDKNKGKKTAHEKNSNKKNSSRDTKAKRKDSSSVSERLSTGLSIGR